jgi:hypothetical protein
MPGTTNVSTPGAGEFGYSVAISKDERWIYIGAPGINSVYAYGRVDAVAQTLTLTTTAVTTTVNIAASIQIDNQQQLKVTVNGTVLTLNVDYTVAIDFTAVTFVTPVAVGIEIVIDRLTSKTFASGSTTYALSPYLFTATNLNAFTVTVNNVTQRPGLDYFYSAGNLQFYSAPTQSVTLPRLVKLADS